MKKTKLTDSYIPTPFELNKCHENKHKKHTETNEIANANLICSVLIKCLINNSVSITSNLIKIIHI